MRLLVTRPEPDAGQLAEMLQARGHDVVIEPLLTIDFTNCDKIHLEDIQGLIATSRNGLRALSASPATVSPPSGSPPSFRPGQMTGQDPGQGAADIPLLAKALTLPLFTVGPGTAELARDMGFAKLHCGAGRAADLPELIARTLRPDEGALLHLAGAKLAADLAPALEAEFFEYVRRTVYKTQALGRFRDPTRVLLQAKKIDAVVLMSPRTASIYAKLIKDEQLVATARKMTHFCLSQPVSERLCDLGDLEIKTAIKPNMEEMLALIADSVAKRR